MFKYLFILFFTSSIAFGQFNYYLGYRDGYKYGCQCLNIPTKNVAYVTGSYDQGYVDGKLDGIIFIRNTQNTGNTNTYNIKPHNYDQPVYSPDFNTVYQSMAQKQQLLNERRIIIQEEFDKAMITLMNRVNQRATKSLTDLELKETNQFKNQAVEYSKGDLSNDTYFYNLLKWIRDWNSYFSKF
jgi:hypothetical protein